ncbi:MAG: STAS domain-containing protein [Bacteroidota bacterium]
MTYSIFERNAVQVLEVQNLFNELDNKEILTDVQNRIERGFNNFIVDLSQLDFMNSVGLNFLISVMTKSRKSGGDVTIVNANDQVISLLEITKLKKLFKMQSTVEDALASLQ